MMRTGGRAAVVVPDGVLFGSSTARTAIRKMLVEDHKLDGIIKLPSGVFCAIVVFTKTGVGGTDQVWFYVMQADGFSLDDRRSPLLDAEKLGAVLSADDHAKNNLPDILAR
jgi:type I restriction enzyme M protein